MKRAAFARTQRPIFPCPNLKKIKMWELRMLGLLIVNSMSSWRHLSFYWGWKPIVSDHPVIRSPFCSSHQVSHAFFRKCFPLPTMPFQTNHLASTDTNLPCLLHVKTCWPQSNLPASSSRMLNKFVCAWTSQWNFLVNACVSHFGTFKIKCVVSKSQVILESIQKFHLLKWSLESNKSFVLNEF